MGTAFVRGLQQEHLKRLLVRWFSHLHLPLSSVPELALGNVPAASLPFHTLYAAEGEGAPTCRLTELLLQPRLRACAFAVA